MEGFIFGRAYVRREICVSKLIGLAYSWKEFTIFALFCSVFEGNFQVQVPGSLYLEGRLNGGVFALRVWEPYIWRGLYMEGLIFGILRYVTRKPQLTADDLSKSLHPFTWLFIQSTICLKKKPRRLSEN